MKYLGEVRLPVDGDKFMFCMSDEEIMHLLAISTSLLMGKDVLNKEQRELTASMNKALINCLVERSTGGNDA